MQQRRALWEGRVGERFQGRRRRLGRSAGDEDEGRCHTQATNLADEQRTGRGVGVYLDRQDGHVPILLDPLPGRLQAGDPRDSHPWANALKSECRDLGVMGVVAYVEDFHTLSPDRLVLTMALIGLTRPPLQAVVRVSLRPSDRCPTHRGPPIEIRASPGSGLTRVRPST